MNKTTNKYTPEVRERAVRMVLNGEGQHESRWSAILSISTKIGCTTQTLNELVKKSEIESGQRGGITSETAEKMNALKREVRKLKQANEILRKALPGSRYAIWMRVEDHRADYGVELICRVLPIAPATFYDNLAKRTDPSRLRIGHCAMLN